MSLLRETWLRIRNMMKFCTPTRTSLRDKALAVAGRVTMTKAGEFTRVSCPVCLEALRAPIDSDIRMTLAVHLSLWHPEDVKLQWDIMQNKRQPVIHLPSLVVGIALAALLCVSTKSQSRRLAFKKRDF